MAFVGLQPSSSSSRATKLALNLLCFVLLMNTCHGGWHWSSGLATWYGSPTGGGSDGGACGYASTVEQMPFSDMIAAVGPARFENGKGCGVCYEVRCTEHAACSGKPVRVTATDKCPECEANHFDLSGAACGAMAKSGQAELLRNAGRIQIQYKRVRCKFPGVAIAFHVDSGSNPYYFSTVIEYPDEDGALKAVELQQAGQPGTWLRMNQQWGAVWNLNGGSMLQAPFSLRLTEAKHGKTIVLNNVIPKGWQPGQTYHATSNF